MSASQSFLSSPDYGYDYVAAVTQDSINATAMAFLNTRRPTIDVCYIYDAQGDPELIDYETLKKKAHGADPFAVAASGPERQTQLKNLDDAGFMFGFSAAMGLPHGFKPDSLPDMVTFGATAEAPLTYRLLCKHFLLVELKQIPHKPPVFQSFAQPEGPPGQPWIFSFKIRLKKMAVADNRAFMQTPAFGNLPEAARIKIAAKPEDFTINQLLYEFNEAASDAQPDISAVDRILKEKLREDFSIRYFNAMQAAGAPMLSVAPVGDNPFAGMSTGFSINPSPANPKLATLNYLCASAGRALPAPKPFAWSWIDAAQAQQFDGVCVINKRDFVEHLRQPLDDYFKQNCWVPHPLKIEVYLLTYDARFGVVPFSADWKGKQRCEFKAPETGDVVLTWNFDASDEYDYLSGSSWMLGDCSFSMKVSVTGNTVTIEQHALVYCKLVMVTFDRHEWNLVDLRLTDTYTLSAEHDGKLAVKHTTATQDDSSPIGYDFAVPLMKKQFEAIQSIVKARVQSRLVNFPLGDMNSVMFPGNKAFLFKEVAFSEHQDLVAHITYADPT
ncbi:MAG: hypothetical protein V4693_14295 [Pseudomonadota bacterium]